MATQSSEQFTRIQDEFEALVEPMLPAIEQWIAEFVGYKNIKINLSKVSMTTTAWGGRGISVRFDTAWHEDENAVIPFEYFNDPENFLVKAIANKHNQDYNPRYGGKAI